MEIASYVVEPQTIFVPYLVDVLNRAGLKVDRVDPEFNLDHVARARPQALFLDLDFVDGDPLEALNNARAIVPDALICAYTGEHRSAWSATCRHAGANCVLAKTSGPDEIARGIRRAVEAGQYVDPRVDA